MDRSRREFFRVAMIGFALCAASVMAGAQTYPTRMVRFIVPFGPTAGADTAARLFADRLATRWGKPVVVENRPGGDGLVAIGTFTGANDDHTLLFIPAGTFTVHPYQHDKLPYDADRDLLPIAGITTIVLALSVSASLKVDSLAELVVLAQAKPGTLNAAAANGNADFLLSGFIKSLGLQIAKVPYRDILQAPNDLGEGRIQMLMSSLAIALPQMQAGRIKVLAVTSAKRAPTAPEIPTVTEAGYPVLELESLVGLFGPRGMPGELRARIAADLKAIAAEDPVIADRLAATGQIVNVREPDAFAAGIAAQRAKLATIAKALGIKPAQ